MTNDICLNPTMQILNKKSDISTAMLQLHYKAYKTDMQLDLNTKYTKKQICTDLVFVFCIEVKLNFTCVCSDEGCTIAVETPASY